MKLFILIPLVPLIIRQVNGEKCDTTAGYECLLSSNPCPVGNSCLETSSPCTTGKSCFDTNNPCRGGQKCLVTSCPVPTNKNSGLDRNSKATSQADGSYKATCNTGYYSTGGTGSLTCTDGSWGGYIECSPQCPTPNIANSGLSRFATITGQTQQWYNNAATVNIKCTTDGYYRSGGSEKLTCANGRWSSFIECSPQCPHPTWRNSGLSKSATITSPTKTWYNPGDSVSPACPGGFKALVYSALTCRQDSSLRWDGGLKCVPQVAFTVAKTGAFSPPQLLAGAGAGAGASATWTDDSNNDLVVSRDNMWSSLVERDIETNTFSIRDNTNAIVASATITRETTSLTISGTWVGETIVQFNRIVRNGLFVVAGGSGQYTWTSSPSVSESAMRGLTWSAPQSNSYELTGTLRGIPAGSTEKFVITVVDRIYGLYATRVVVLKSIEALGATIDGRQGDPQPFGITLATQLGLFQPHTVGNVTVPPVGFERNVTENGTFSMLLDAVGVGVDFLTYCQVLSDDLQTVSFPTNTSTGSTAVSFAPTANTLNASNSSTTTFAPTTNPSNGLTTTTTFSPTTNPSNRSTTFAPTASTSSPTPSPPTPVSTTTPTTRCKDRTITRLRRFTIVVFPTATATANATTCTGNVTAAEPDNESNGVYDFTTFLQRGYASWNDSTSINFFAQCVQDGEHASCEGAADAWNTQQLMCVDEWYRSQLTSETVTCVDETQFYTCAPPANVWIPTQETTPPLQNPYQLVQLTTTTYGGSFVQITNNNTFTIAGGGVSVGVSVSANTRDDVNMSWNLFISGSALIDSNFTTRLSTSNCSTINDNPTTTPSVFDDDGLPPFVIECGSQTSCNMSYTSTTEIDFDEGVAIVIVGANETGVAMCADMTVESTLVAADATWIQCSPDITIAADRITPTATTAIANYYTRAGYRLPHIVSAGNLNAPLGGGEASSLFCARIGNSTHTYLQSSTLTNECATNLQRMADAVDNNNNNNGVVVLGDNRSFAVDFECFTPYTDATYAVVRATSASRCGEHLRLLNALAPTHAPTATPSTMDSFCENMVVRVSETCPAGFLNSDVACNTRCALFLAELVSLSEAAACFVSIGPDALDTLYSNLENVTNSTAEITTQLTAYARVCNFVRARSFPNGLTLTNPTDAFGNAAPGACVISGIPSNNGVFPEGKPQRSFVRVRVLKLAPVGANATVADIVAATSETNANIFLQLFPPITVVYADLNSTDDVYEVTTGTKLTANMVISGGQPPYSVGLVEKLPLALAFETSYRVVGVIKQATQLDNKRRVTEALSMEAINVRDKNNALQTPSALLYRSGVEDCTDDANGPNGLGCENNAPCVDGDVFDSSFTCECGDNVVGPNCNTPAVAADDGGTTTTVVLVVVFLLVLGGVVVFFRIRRKAEVPHDFEAQLQKMINSGQIRIVGTGPRKVPIEKKRDHIILVDVLGKGEFGEVMKGVYSEDGSFETVKVVAIKTLKGEKGDSVNRNEKETLMAEATINAQFQHVNVVNLVGVVTVGQPLMIVLEICEKGELRKFVQQKRVPRKTKAHLLYGVCKGMEYLTALKFIHRDLAARNVLIDNHKNAKVADFGLSKDTEAAEYYVASGGKVPIRWTSVEALTNRKYSEKSDVWSFGIVCYEVWTNGGKPYGKWPNSVVIEQVVNGYTLPCPDECPHEIYETCVAPCFIYETKKRPTFTILCDRYAALTGCKKRQPKTNTSSTSSTHTRAVDGGDVGNTDDNVEPQGSQLRRSDFTDDVIVNLEREIASMRFFHGKIDESECQRRLRLSNVAEADISQSTPFDEREICLLRQIDDFTLIYSILVNGSFGHHVLEFTKDQMWMERDPPADKQSPLGKSLVDALGEFEQRWPHIQSCVPLLEELSAEMTIYDNVAVDVDLNKLKSFFKDDGKSLKANNRTKKKSFNDVPDPFVQTPTYVSNTAFDETQNTVHDGDDVNVIVDDSNDVNVIVDDGDLPLKILPVKPIAKIRARKQRSSSTGLLVNDDDANIDESTI